MGIHMLQIITLTINSPASLNCWSGRGFASESDLHEPATFESWHKKCAPLSAMFFHLLLWCGRISALDWQLIKAGYRSFAYQIIRMPEFTAVNTLVVWFCFVLFPFGLSNQVLKTDFLPRKKQDSAATAALYHRNLFAWDLRTEGQSLPCLNFQSHKC